MTLAQRKIILTVGILAFLFAAFLLFIYYPVRVKVRNLKAQLINLETQIKDIELTVSGAKSTQEGIRLLKERYRQLDNKFPLRYEDALAMIPELARRLNIEVVSVNNTAPVIFTDKSGKRMEVESKGFSFITVSLVLRCFYKDLVRYLDTLDKVLPAFVTVERVSLDREKPASLRLNIRLTLNLYFLS